MFDQVYQAAEKVYEMVKLGAQIEAIEHRFIAFAGGAEQASKYLEAFNIGAQNTVDEMTAMEKSAKLLQMGLATNADEMQLMAAMATKLGNQTISAGARVDDFSLLLANQAVRRLDNFGMSSGRVRDRIDELIESGQALNREQAFKMAVMEEGSTALAKLGDTSEMTAVKLDQTEGSWKNITSNIAEMAAVWAEWTGTIDRWKDGLGAVEGFFNLWAKGAKHILTGGKDAGQVLQAYNGYIADGVSTMSQYGKEVFISSQMVDSLSTSSWGAVLGTTEFSSALEGSTGITLANIDAIRESAIAVEALTVKQAGLAASLKDASGAQVAQTAITELGGLLEQDKITIDEYSTAVTQTQLAFGLADEASIRLSAGVLDLVTKFGEGQVKAENFDEALLGLYTATENQRAKTAELGEALANLPEEKTIRINVEYVEGSRGGGGGGGGGGSSVTNSPIYNFNQTVNTQASSHNVVSDWETARNLVP